MEQTVRCTCGRLWQIERDNAVPARRGRIHCRCNLPLLSEDDGGHEAYLIEPRERAVALRKLLGRGTLGLLRFCRACRIPIWYWINLADALRLMSPNRAIRVALASRVVVTQGNR